MERRGRLQLGSLKQIYTPTLGCNNLYHIHGFPKYNLVSQAALIRALASARVQRGGEWARGPWRQSGLVR